MSGLSSEFPLYIPALRVVLLDWCHGLTRHCVNSVGTESSTSYTEWEPEDAGQDIPVVIQDAIPTALSTDTRQTENSRPHRSIRKTVSLADGSILEEENSILPLRVEV